VEASVADAAAGSRGALGTAAVAGTPGAGTLAGPAVAKAPDTDALACQAAGALSGLGSHAAKSGPQANVHAVQILSASSVVFTHPLAIRVCLIRTPAFNAR
jgi:hypothetical protein